MRLYFASGLENGDWVKELAADATHIGHEITYAWWTHGSVQDEGPARIQEVAEAEIKGVSTADAVLILMPGGRGTHVELGAAIALGKPVYLFGDLLGGYTRECSFYRHPTVILMGAADPRLLLNELLVSEDNSFRSRKAKND